MTKLIRIKEYDFDFEAFRKFSKKINTLIDEEKSKDDSNIIDLSDKVSAIVNKSSLKFIKEYVDHHSSNIEAEKEVSMKPIKPNIHKTVADLFNEFDIWDHEFIKKLSDSDRIKVYNVARELQMMALINKYCVFIAFQMTLILDDADIENLDEQKMIQMFKDELDIDMPNPPSSTPE